MWGDDVNLCFLQVKELSVEQPGEHFLPLTCPWGGLVQEGAVGRGVCFAPGAAWWASGSTSSPLCWWAGSPCAPHPCAHMLLPSCMACSAGVRGVAGSPWFCCRVVSDWLYVPGCALSARGSALELGWIVFRQGDTKVSSHSLPSLFL